jgi:hypothetical protein
MDPICFGWCSLCMQTLFKKCPFKENGKLSKLFRLVPLGLNLPAGSDTPAEKNPAGYQTPQNKILRGIRPHGTKFCGVSDPANNGRVVYI